MTALALLGLASLMAMPSIAQARYRDGMNLYQYVGSNPTRYVDPQGTWKRVGNSGHVWEAEKGDTLSGLAAKQEYGGNGQNWRCLWPTKDTKDHGYPNTIKPCDKYDASNLARTWGPWVYINMDTRGAYGKNYQEDRPQAQAAPTGTQVYEILKTQSGEGATPIHYYEILGHSMDWPGMSAGGKTNKKKEKKGGTRDDFYPGRYLPNQPAPTFARAQQRKGPHRCWFTRSANGYSFACGGYSFGKAFAGSFLRRGARINTSPQGVKIYNNDAWLHRNDWGFGKDGDVDWSSNIDEFLKSPGWATVWGRL
jgi:hypothetical protein